MMPTPVETHRKIPWRHGLGCDGHSLPNIQALVEPEPALGLPLSTACRFMLIFVPLLCSSRDILSFLVKVIGRIDHDAGIPRRRQVAK